MKPNLQILPAAQLELWPLLTTIPSSRALCSFRDGDLLQLPDIIRKQLINAATKIDDIPKVHAKSKTIS